MKGELCFLIDEGKKFASVSLPKSSFTIGSSRDCDLQVNHRGLARRHAVLDWDRKACTWRIKAFDAMSSIKVQHVDTRERASYLQDGYIIELAALTLRFDRESELPKVKGKGVLEIPIKRKMRVVFGREDKPEKGVCSVVLDSDESSISRMHLSIWWEKGKGYRIEDSSRTGTFLNGKSLKSAILVAGDRFKVGSYTFEFTGFSARLITTTMAGDLKARHLTVIVGKGKGRKAILRDVSLDIGSREFVGILGGSGQGKSTLMNAMCGINPATSGTVLINNKKLSGGSQMAQQLGIGYVPQDDIVHRELTVKQAIRYSARLRLDPRTPKGSVERLVGQTIERLGLTEHGEKRITKLSGGQRKRVSIATELLAQPRVLFLDEPSSGLDPSTEHSLMKLLRMIANSGSTVICTTHVLHRAYLFDEVVFIHAGKLIYQGKADQAPEHFLTPAEVESTAGGTVSFATHASVELDRDPIHKLPDVYDEIIESPIPAEEWEAKHRDAYPLDAGDEASLLPPPKRKVARAKKPGYSDTLRTLLRRQWTILRADKLNLVFLLAQPLIIGLLVGWVAEDAVLRMFLCVVATLWFGCSNGAQQIVRELAIFRRERVCGQGLNSYVHSKYLFLTVITTMQAFILFSVIVSTSHIWHPRGGSTAAVAEDEEESESYGESIRKELEEKYLAALDATSEEEDIFSDFTARVQGVDEAEGPIDMKDLEAELEKEKEYDPGDLVRGTKEKDEGNLRLLNVASQVAVFLDMGDSILNSVDAVPDEERTPRAIELVVFKTMAINFGLKLSALILTACVGVTIGLAISALVNTNTQAVMWVPLVLIPQILFGGFVVTVPEMSQSVRSFSHFVPSFSAHRLMDVSNLYGQATPRMSNRTRYPVFLTPGEKDWVKWERAGKAESQDYDKKSPHNVSWQNLIVFPESVGARKVDNEWVRYEHRGRKRKIEKIPESTKQRNDVRYPTNTLYQFTTPGIVAMIYLGAWIGSCYFVTIIGLVRKQTGT